MNKKVQLIIVLLCFVVVVLVFHFDDIGWICKIATFLICFFFALNCTLNNEKTGQEEHKVTKETQFVLKRIESIPLKLCPVN